LRSIAEQPLWRRLITRGNGIVLPLPFGVFLDYTNSGILLAPKKVIRPELLGFGGHRRKDVLHDFLRSPGIVNLA
jgi:hypothetical protein